MIGHGRGSLSGLKYATSCDKPLSHYVSIAAPYFEKSTTTTKSDNPDSFDWKVYQKGELVIKKMQQKEMDLYNAWDCSHGMIFISDDIRKLLTSFLSSHKSFVCLSLLVF